MGVLVGRLFKAGLVVVPSMVIGVVIGIAVQAGFLGADGLPLIGRETMSGRWITPFDSGTAYNRSAVFDEEQVRRVYEAVGPAIVSVTGPASRGGRQGTSSASGIVIDADGHVLTNNHVVEGLRGQIDVVLAGGRRVPAEVLGAILATTWPCSRWTRPEHYRWRRWATRRWSDRVTSPSPSGIRPG